MAKGRAARPKPRFLPAQEQFDYLRKGAADVIRGEELLRKLER
jgi:hypothetical protein